MKINLNEPVKVKLAEIVEDLRLIINELEKKPKWLPLRVPVQLDNGRFIMAYHQDGKWTSIIDCDELPDLYAEMRRRNEKSNHIRGRKQ